MLLYSIPKSLLRAIIPKHGGVGTQEWMIDNKPDQPGILPLPPLHVIGAPQALGCTALAHVQVGHDSQEVVECVMLADVSPPRKTHADHGDG